MPCSLTPVELRCQAIAASPCGLPPFIERRLPRCGHFEAQSHGLYARCLRFAAPVTRSPRKTRFRSVANLYRAGFKPAGFLTPFRYGLRRQSQATKLCLAHINLPPLLPADNFFKIISNDHFVCTLFPTLEKRGQIYLIGFSSLIQINFPPFLMGRESRNITD